MPARACELDIAQIVLADDEAAIADTLAGTALDPPQVGHKTHPHELPDALDRWGMGKQSHELPGALHSVRWPSNTCTMDSRAERHDVWHARCLLQRAGTCKGVRRALRTALRCASSSVSNLNPLPP